LQQRRVEARDLISPERGVVRMARYLPAANAGDDEQGDEDRRCDAEEVPDARNGGAC